MVDTYIIDNIGYGLQLNAKEYSLSASHRHGIYIFHTLSKENVYGH